MTNKKKLEIISISEALHTGLEPAVFRLGGGRLTIWPMELKRHRKIENSYILVEQKYWKSRDLPFPVIPQFRL